MIVSTAKQIRIVNVSLPVSATMLKGLFTNPRPGHVIVELHLNSTSAYTITDGLTNGTLAVAANSHKVIPARECLDNLKVHGSGTLDIELYYDD